MRLMKEMVFILVCLFAAMAPVTAVAGVFGGGADHYVLVSESQQKVVFYNKLSSISAANLQACAQQIHVLNWSFRGEVAWGDIGATCELFRPDGVFRCWVDKALMDSGQLDINKPSGSIKYQLKSNSPCGPHTSFMLPSKIYYGIDKDDDGVPDMWDVCPEIAGFEQLDSDGNGIGDACQCNVYEVLPLEVGTRVAKCKQLLSDDDCDTVENYRDNCPGDANQNQADADGDHIGDVCDRGLIGDISKKTPFLKSPSELPTLDESSGNAGNIQKSFKIVERKPILQSKPYLQVSISPEVEAAQCRNYLFEDDDGDGLVNYQDNCPGVSNNSPSNPQTDWDHDSIGDVCDNCADTYNADQKDCDGDGIGDACDIDCPVQSDGKRLCSEEQCK